MRTAEEILEQYRLYDEPISDIEIERGGHCFVTEDIIKAINEARKEAIEECAEKATVKYDTDPAQYGTIAIGGGIIRVNKQSILSLIDELK